MSLRELLQSVVDSTGAHSLLWVGKCLDLLEDCVEYSALISSLLHQVDEETVRQCMQRCCHHMCEADDGCWQWVRLASFLAYHPKGCEVAEMSSELLTSLCPALAWADILLLEAAACLLDLMSTSSVLCREKLRRHSRWMEKAAAQARKMGAGREVEHVFQHLASVEQPPSKSQVNAR